MQRWMQRFNRPLLAHYILFVYKLGSPWSIDQRKRKRANFWEDVFNYETEDEFQKFDKMRKQTFLLLMKRLAPILAPKRRSNGEASWDDEGTFLPLELKVGIGLRYLAGSSMLDNHRLHRVSRTAVYDAARDFIDTVLQTPSVGPIVFNTSAEYLKTKAEMY
jgi:hypothetical protein